MRIKLLDNKISFNKIVETFRRETRNTWKDGDNPKVINESYDTFEYTEEEKTEEESNK